MRKTTPPSPPARTVLISGHPRSGTTMLARLVATHPHALVTNEFKCFSRLDCSVIDHFKSVRKNVYRYPLTGLHTRYKPFISRKLLSGYQIKKVISAIFIMRYFVRLLSNSRGHVDMTAVSNAYRSLFPWALVVGDKHPDYMRHLPALSGLPDLTRIVIYRDCRDVVRSALEQARTSWKNQHWVANFSDAQSLAQRWVEYINTMEQCREAIHIIRYEDLVRDPSSILNNLGRWLNLDPGGYNRQLPTPVNIGKYRSGLSREDLGIINRIAGPTMERLGYAL